MTEGENINFDDFDFTNVVKHIEKRKEIQKALSKEERKSKKLENEKLATYYQYAIMDD